MNMVALSICCKMAATNISYIPNMFVICISISIRSPGSASMVE